MSDFSSLTTHHPSLELKMLRVVNNITGAILGVALLGGVLWLRLSFTAREMLFGYFTTTVNSPKANDALPIYPIIGMFVGGALVTIIIFVSSRRNKQRKAIGATTTDPIWIMAAVFVLSVAGGAIYGHNFG